jgi:hypothetical protein
VYYKTEQLKNKSIKLFGRRFGAGLQYVKQAVFRKEGATIAHYFIAQN